ncbi:hypothetical protein M758_5G098500 [Ceratodon purpureus]|nr:hypothetical protein M758_5G098500 [Ceratodon purpureus]
MHLMFHLVLYRLLVIMPLGIPTRKLPGIYTQKLPGNFELYVNGIDTRFGNFEFYLNGSVTVLNPARKGHQGFLTS